MRKKGVEFSEVYDIRALRIIVDDLKDCYTALGVVHNLWSPIPKEFDDYISNPKGNNYRSLHTAVRCPDGRSLEIQIRTDGNAQACRTRASPRTGATRKAASGRTRTITTRRSPGCASC
jgi:(p)ppGpp synthase/HD superfamily hydrolase